MDNSMYQQEVNFLIRIKKELEKELTMYEFVIEVRNSKYYKIVVRNLEGKEVFSYGTCTLNSSVNQAYSYWVQFKDNILKSFETKEEMFLFIKGENNE